MSRLRDDEFFVDPQTGQRTRKAVIRLDESEEVPVPTKTNQPPLTSASSYSREKMEAVRRAKASRTPVGFTEAPDSNKLRAISQQLHEQKRSAMPKPDFANLKDQVRQGMAQHPMPMVPPQPEAPSMHKPVPPRPEMPERPKTLRQAREESRQRKVESHNPELEELKRQFRPTEEEHLLQGAVSPDRRDTSDDTEARVSMAEGEMVAEAQQTLPELDADYEGVDILRKTLMTPERKSVIEGRLEEMDLGEMVSRNEIIQFIPIVEGKFSIVLKNIQHFEIQYCLRRMYRLVGSNIYLSDMLNMYKLVCSLVEINGAALPSHRVHEGTFDEEVDDEAFDLKFKVISRMATPVLADISVQYDWFIERLHKLMDVEAVKNG